jgi:hypothetical protein
MYCSRISTATDLSQLLWLAQQYTAHKFLQHRTARHDETAVLRHVALGVPWQSNVRTHWENVPLLHVVLLPTARSVIHGTLASSALLCCWKLCCDRLFPSIRVSLVLILISSMYKLLLSLSHCSLTAYFVSLEHSTYRHTFQVKVIVLGISNCVPPCHISWNSIFTFL